MEHCVEELLGSIGFGALQEHEHICLFPLLSPQEGFRDYMTLTAALEEGCLVISEIDQDGSVPDLKVKSLSNKPILLLDGEELSGGKQNRVLNTSILFPEKKTLTIPVSCTEVGRWGYSSEHFIDSGFLLHHASRSRRHRSVTESLHSKGSYASDQGEVWAGIHGLHMASGTHSPTSAMKDAFVKKQKVLEDCLAAFPLVPDQRGLLVLVNGKVTGFDLVSSPAAYKKLHERLAKSYVMDGLVGEDQSTTGTDPEKAAKDFVFEVLKCQESRFESVGYGWDYRYQSPGTVGSSLVNGDKVIHTAFFRHDADERHDSVMAMRRRYRHTVRDDRDDLD